MTQPVIARSVATKQSPNRGRTMGVLVLLLLLPTAASAQSRFAEPADGFGVADPVAAGFSPARLDSLSARLQRYVDDGQAPGSVLFVARDGDLVFHQAFGWRDREARDAMVVDDLFRIASQTKAIVSTAVMILQERGRLTIGDPLSKYLPEFASTTVAVPRESGGYDVEPATRAITIRDLLTHTAGIGYGWGPAQTAWEEAGILGWYFAERDEPMADVVSRMASLPMNAQPGSAFVYGYNTDILGVVVEKVSGRSLADFLRAEIFEPLGMDDTYFFVPPDDGDRLTAVYGSGDGELVRAPATGTMASQGHYLEGPRVATSGGAGLVSTAADYARFLQMMLNGGELGDARILAPATVRLMTSDHLRGLQLGPGEGFGLGFYVIEDVGARGLPGSRGEFGWGGAYHSSYWVDPVAGLVFVYLTQINPAGPIDDHAVLRAMVYAALVTA